MQKFAPGIWFGNGDRGCHAQFTQDGDRFRSARNYIHALQRRNVLVAFVGRFGNAQKRSRPDAGQEDDQVKFTCQKPCGEAKRFGVGFQRHFAHRGRDDGFASISGNQFGEFRGPTAFQREHSQSRKSAHDIELFTRKAGFATSISRRPLAMPGWWKESRSTQASFAPRTKTSSPVPHRMAPAAR